MSRRALSVLIFILAVALAVAILTSERGLSGAMERIGSTISRLFD